MNIRFIRLAHEKELGIGDPRQIEIVGYDIENEEPWNFIFGGQWEITKRWQVMAEGGNNPIVLVNGHNGETREFTLAELLPHGFELK